MKRFLAVLLLCPLLAVAAEWQYGGEAPAGSKGQATATDGTPTDDKASMKGAVTMSAMQMEAPSSAPTNNMSMAKVRETVGEPELVVAAVGEPPITRWQYPDYVVYFERDRVIISVAGHL